MSITALDRDCALIVIDLQKMIVRLPLAHPFGEVVARTVELLDAFRARGRPVVLVNTDGVSAGRTEAPSPTFEVPPDWTELVAELNAQPTDILITKRSWSAFPNTRLEARLKALGVTQIVLAGVATSMGVESTAREAHGLGFNVALAVDAMSDLSGDAHAHAVSRIFPNLGETAAAAEIVSGLAAACA